MTSFVRVDGIIAEDIHRCNIELAPAEHAPLQLCGSVESLRGFGFLFTRLRHLNLFTVSPRDHPGRVADSGPVGVDPFQGNPERTRYQGIDSGSGGSSLRVPLEMYTTSRGVDVVF